MLGPEREKRTIVAHYSLVLDFYYLSVQHTSFFFFIEVNNRQVIVSFGRISMCMPTLKGQKQSTNVLAPFDYFQGNGRLGCGFKHGRKRKGEELRILEYLKQE